MEYSYLRDIKLPENIGKRVFGIFLVKSVELLDNKNGADKYLKMIIQDKDISTELHKWNANDNDIERLQVGKVYCGAIDVKPYAKSSAGYSCALYNYDEMDEDPSKFINWAEGMDEAHYTIQTALSIISNSIYHKLVYNILSDCWQDFCIWTAAQYHHHDILGGLIVHTAEVIKQSIIMADFWNEKYGQNFINKPLLISGALLHDIYKTKEISVDNFTGASVYTTEASLETHLTMCTTKIDLESYNYFLQDSSVLIIYYIYTYPHLISPFHVVYMLQVYEVQLAIPTLFYHGDLILNASIIRNNIPLFASLVISLSNSKFSRISNTLSEKPFKKSLKFSSICSESFTNFSKSYTLVL